MFLIHHRRGKLSEVQGAVAYTDTKFPLQKVTDLKYQTRFQGVISKVQRELTKPQLRSWGTFRTIHVSEVAVWS